MSDQMIELVIAGSPLLHGFGHGGAGPSISPNVWSVFAGYLVAAWALALFEWSRLSIRGKFFSFSAMTCYAYMRNPFYASYP